VEDEEMVAHYAPMSRRATGVILVVGPLVDRG
jgi:hypothetical protein